ncbi:MAG: hypothetical protein R3E01_04200 [Pirellulaceae bacterium]
MDRFGLELEDVCSGIFAFGTTGSGKTSVLRLLMDDIVNTPFQRHYRGPVQAVAGLWCCVKKDEADNALAVLGHTGMRDRVQHLVPGHFTFNFVSYLLNEQEGGNPAALARLLEKLNKQLNNASQGGNNEQFWAALFFDYLHYGIWVAWLAYRNDVSLEHIYDVITSCPTSLDHANSEQFKASPCWRTLQLADKNVRSDAEDRALFKAGEFFLFRQSVLGDAARGAGLQMASSVLSPFLISPIYETVCANTSSFRPEMALRDYWCIIDAPILVHKQGGMLFSSLLTMLVQDAALRRSNPDTICAIVRDEVQFLVADIEHESMVQSVCRSSMLAHISAAQNIPLLQAASGGDHRAETLVRALLANYRTKLLLANICDATNRMCSDMQGEFKDKFFSISEGPKDPNDLLGSILGMKPLQMSMSEQLHKRLPPENFLTLRRGGQAFNYLIDAYLMIGGHTFADGLPFKKVTFSQR